MGIRGDVAVSVVRCSGKYLVMRRSDHETMSGKWEFPGGEVEDETPREAAARELKEESGISAEAVRSGCSYTGEGSTGLWRLHPFLFEVGSREVFLSREHDKHMWVELEELENMDTVGRMKAAESLGLC